MNDHEFFELPGEEVKRYSGELTSIPEKCDWCPKPSVTKWREGRGTGHSESVHACEDHRHFEHT